MSSAHARIVALATEDAEGWLFDMATTTAHTMDREEIRKCLTSSVEPDEALINGLGMTGTASLFGIDGMLDGEGCWTAAGRAALAVYNRAWRDTLKRALTGAYDLNEVQS